MNRASIPKIALWEHPDAGGVAPAGQKAGAPVEVLAGEIEGLRSLEFEIPAGQEYRHPGVAGRGVFLFFTGGSGRVQTGVQEWTVGEIALLIPVVGEAVTMHADTPLRGLELIMDLAEADGREWEQRRDRFPYFIRYSQCRTYREAIKSPQTVNRTLLAEDVFPRFCAGSVQTRGPDQVGEHAHPMLEQLFLGLPGNDCTVRADGVDMPFGPCDLLHIPLGSRHGVRVDSGRDLHYIWLDFFRSREDMKWITEQHVPVVEKGKAG